MPFNWKKKNRFSRLVADHHLVVETGFPTSLIDLYVRNRGRFRKSTVMKSPSPSPSPLPSPSPSPSQSSGLLIDSVNLSSSTSSIVSLLDSSNSSSGCYDYNENNEIIEEEIEVERSVKLAKSNNEIIEEEFDDFNMSEIDVERSVKLAKSNSLSSCYDYKESDEVIENSSENEVERSVEMTKLNPVLVVLLKVLIMLVLVIGTKRFTFGITVSAFLLFLWESVRKPLLRRPSCVDSKTPIESTFREKKESVEIEDVESKMEVRSEKELDEVRSEELMEVRRKSSRRAVMKSRMKKLVPKKLRKSTMNSKGEMSRELKEYETVKCVKGGPPLVFSSQCSDSKGENLSVLKQEYDEIVKIKKQSSSLTYSSDIYCNDNNKLRIESRQNCGYLVLCLIVLVGLIGGRVLAVSLALSWCLMLKMLQWRNVKFFVS